MVFPVTLAADRAVAKTAPDAIACKSITRSESNRLQMSCE